MSRIRGPYVRFCERDEAVTPHPTRYADRKCARVYSPKLADIESIVFANASSTLNYMRFTSLDFQFFSIICRL